MLLASSAASSGNSNFLIPNGTFIFELLMFIIVLGIVAKFILPPLQNAMEERDAKVRAALQASEEGHHEAERLDAERREVLDQARHEARQIIEDAAREVERLRTEARQRGQSEFERQITAAQAIIDRERAQLQAESIGKLESVVVAAAEHIIGLDVDPAKHHATIAAAIAQAERGTSE